MRKELKKDQRKKRSTAGTILLTAGLLCLAGAAALGLYNIWDSERAGRASAEVEKKLIEKIAENMQENGTAAGGKNSSPQADGLLQTIPLKDPADTPYKDMPVEEIDGYNYIGFLEIPAIGLSLPVMDHWDYDRLKISPCRYSGGYYTDDLVICGHNYYRHFTPVKDNLGMGEDVYFTNVLGESIHYKTVNRETVSPTSIEEMVQNDNNSDRTNEWDLTLFTCNADGQTRSALRCERVE